MKSNGTDLENKTKPRILQRISQRINAYIIMHTGVCKEGPQSFIHSLLNTFLLSPCNTPDTCQALGIRLWHGPQAQGTHVLLWEKQKPNKQIQQIQTRTQSIRDTDAQIETQGWEEENTQTYAQSPGPWKPLDSLRGMSHDPIHVSPPTAVWVCLSEEHEGMQGLPGAHCMGDSCLLHVVGPVRCLISFLHFCIFHIFNMNMLMSNLRKDNYLQKQIRRLFNLPLLYLLISVMLENPYCNPFI